MTRDEVLDKRFPKGYPEACPVCSAKHETDSDRWFTDDFVCRYCMFDLRGDPEEYKAAAAKKADEAAKVRAKRK